MDGTGSVGNETTVALKVGLNKPNFCNVHDHLQMIIPVGFLKECDIHLLTTKLSGFHLGLLNVHPWGQPRPPRFS